MPRKKKDISASSGDFMKPGMATAVIGGQWGDEGKGKITDLLSPFSDIVIRYSGGGNAGHKVINDKGEFRARILPVGMFTDSVRICIIGRGTVPALENIVEELTICDERDLDISRLRIDSSAHLIMPWHISYDRLLEESKDGDAIGTTGNGIGPCYAGKIMRENFRACDLLDFDRFAKRFKEIKPRMFWFLYSQFDKHWAKCPSGCDTCRDIRRPVNESLAEIESQIAYLRDKFGRLDSLIVDTLPLVWDEMDNGARVLLEGAQGGLLSIDGGSYPFVTSSNTGLAAALQGSGISFNKIAEIIGVFKAYTSRVGNGSMPTQMCADIEEKVREAGHEYGTVTGRPRRCGWFDPLAARRVIRENGVTCIALTLLDVLDELSLIGMARWYSCAKEKSEVVCEDVAHMLISPHASAAISYYSGWRHDGKVAGAKVMDALPQRAKDYVTKIENSCGVSVKIISTGSDRSETIILR